MQNGGRASTLPLKATKKHSCTGLQGYYRHYDGGCIYSSSVHVGPVGIFFLPSVLPITM
jgi:hypothetical protein